uniref:Uncharacterized protein n=1 Tax=Otus sunia TaxID=257818 RepID=A0A8C8BCX6_9STRI
SSMGGKGSSKFQENLRFVEVRGLPPLSTLQVIGGNGIGQGGGIERPFQPQLLGCQKAGLGIKVLNFLLELGLPEVYTLLGALGSGSGMFGQLLGLGPGALGLLAASEGLVVQGSVALVPLGGQRLGSAEAGRGQATRGVGPRVQHGHRLRRRLLGQPASGLRHGGGASRGASRG